MARLSWWQERGLRVEVDKVYIEVETFRELLGSQIPALTGLSRGHKDWGHEE